MKKIYFLSFVAALVVVSLVSEFAFPAQRAALLALLLHKNCGCSYATGLKSIPPVARQLADIDALQAANRKLGDDGAGLEQWQTPHGVFWAPKGDPSLVMVMAEMNQQPYGPPEWLKGAVVLDCGAHLGTFTKYALDAGAKKVVAIDPGPQQVACLRKTFEKEIAAGRVVVVGKAVMDGPGTLELDIASGTANSTLTDPKELAYGVSNDQHVKVETIGIDALVRELGLERVDFIKMDIEGSEVAALKGARSTLQKDKPRLSLAGYHKHDDAVTIPKAAREANAAYRAETLFCRLDMEDTHPLTIALH